MRRRYKGFKLKQLKIYIAKPDDNFKNAEEFDKARREEMAEVYKHGVYKKVSVEGC